MQTKNPITAASEQNVAPATPAAELKGRAKLAALVTAVLLCCASGASHPAPAVPRWTGDVAKAEVTLVADGRANAVIVVPSRASRAAAEGAEILRDHLLQISGARLRVLKESEMGQVKVAEDRIEPVSGKAVAESYILVGEGELTEKLGISSKGLGPGGVLIRTVGALQATGLERADAERS